MADNNKIPLGKFWHSNGPITKIDKTREVKLEKYYGITKVFCAIYEDMSLEHVTSTIFFLVCV